MSQAKSGGLAGVSAGQTAICTVEDGESLCYRGYAIDDLAQYGCFEEVAYLLIHETLPDKAQLRAYQQKLQSLRQLPSAVLQILEAIPAKAHPMDVLRSGVSMLGCVESEGYDVDPRDLADRLLACLPGMLFYWYHYQNSGQRIALDREELDHSAYILALLTDQTPSVKQQAALDDSLILYAEHEFNASTFAARVTAATLSDFHSAVVSAIGTLRGPLHGGANEAAMALIAQFDSVDAARAGLLQMLANKELVMGFGHRVYRTADPRSPIMKAWGECLAQTEPHRRLFAISDCIEGLMKTEKKLFANVDFPSALVYHILGFPTELFTPLFVLSRISGWSAHIIEQRANNRLIRPAAAYIGPDRQHYIKLEER